MDFLLKQYCKALEAITATALAVMVVLVLGNVILRYAFNSGIAVSEEISRWLFVWIVFLGGVFALREHGHLGTDMLVGRLGLAGRKVCLAIGYALMLAICVMLFLGSLEQTRLNWDVSAPSSGASLACFYAVGIVFSVSAALILVADGWRLLFKTHTLEDLIVVRENEEQRS
jgi:TRAP-type transport system small permease protein